MPLQPLAQAGVLHLATLNIALPRLLQRLQERDMGDAAHAVAREILAVETSTLPWARQARDAHARAVAAVGAALPAEERELLARLLPKAKAVGETIDIPSLRQLVTEVRPGLQHLLSHGVWHRRFAQLLLDCRPDAFRSFMLRSGCGQGSTAWVRPLVPDFFERSHLCGQDRWQAGAYRMGVRHILGYEPMAGVAAAGCQPFRRTARVTWWRSPCRCRRAPTPAGHISGRWTARWRISTQRRRSRRRATRWRCW
jgi:hypothetical protein